MMKEEVSGILREITPEKANYYKVTIFVPEFIPLNQLPLGPPPSP